MHPDQVRQWERDVAYVSELRQQVAALTARLAALEQAAPEEVVGACSK